jgi:hypothetical protein
VAAGGHGARWYRPFIRMSLPVTRKTASS